MQTFALDQKIDALEEYLQEFEKHNKKVSQGGVGWHIDHSLKVINTIVEGMKASDPSTFKNNFSFLGKLFFFLNYFPKGKAKAPKMVTPPEHISKEGIQKQIEQARVSVKNLMNLDDNSYVPHPIFGNVNKKRGVRFMEIHTHHHLKIIRSILKSLA